MRIDLHVHSKYSTRPSQWILQKIDCPESFTEPARIYDIAKKKGMSLVTVTDHNTIDGALELAHLPDTFISEEVTSYFPEDGCKIHVLVWDIREKHHEEIQKIRDNLFDLVAYLRQEKLAHGLAHPLFAVNDRLRVEHFEKLLLLFQNFELNGARDEATNGFLKLFLSRLTAEDMQFLADKHDLPPAFERPWEKHLFGGSDDHSSLNIANRFTEVQNTSNLAGFFAAINLGRAIALGGEATPLTMAHNLYGIAYQFYKSKFQLERHLHKDIFLRFLDRFLNNAEEREEGLLDRFYDLWNHRKRARSKIDHSLSLQQLFRFESRQLILDDPELMRLVRKGGSRGADMEQHWFDFVNKVSNKVLVHFGQTLLDQLSGANFINVFSSVGSSGALYSLLAPYFLAFSLFRREQLLVRQIQNGLAKLALDMETPSDEAHVAHFTDTFFEVNGVALTLQQQVQRAAETGKKLTVITCDNDIHASRAGVKNFEPVGIYELPVYRPQKLCLPPFLEMLRYCYENGFTQLHSATPGPMGLAALAISRILKLPICGTYHTAIPQYACCLTGDNSIEDLTWSYMVWYYNRMDRIFVPSQSTFAELEGKGIHADKMVVFPRGIDIDRFHPAKRSSKFDQRYGLEGRRKLLYVGRVSQEKNLPFLCEVFKEICKAFPDVTLLVVGDGPYREAMTEELQGLPAVFTGYLSGEDLPAAYASSDLFVFPSTTDTFGNVVLEAQASGLPVIVTDSGGPQENIIEGKTGLIVPADNHPALYEAIAGLLQNRILRQAMSGKARRYMEQRSFDRAFQETWRMYETNPAHPACVSSEAV